MSEANRAILCVLSALVAYGAVAFSGAWEPAARLLHRWTQGLLLLFVLIFVLSMFLTLRGRIARSFWVVPISAALGYPAATLAYIIYFATFETQRLLNSLSQSNLFGAIVVLLFVGPTASFAWFFGAIAGAVFFLLGRRLQAAGI